MLVVKKEMLKSTGENQLQYIQLRYLPVFIPT